MSGLMLQVAPPSPTWFSVSPEWGWYIVVFFFLAGIAGGAAFLSGLLDFLGSGRDRRMTRVGYWIALVAIAIGGLILIVDLTRPERFWHMFWKSDTGGIMFKYYAPLSLGTAIILGFIIFVALASAAALADMGKFPRWFAQFGEGTLGKIVALGCLVTGAALAGYTGLDLTMSNRPLWGDTPWFALLLLLTGIAAGAAAMILFGWRQSHADSMRWIEQMESYSLVLSLVVLAMIFATIWSVVRVVWSGAWGALLLFGVVFLGVVIPLVLHYARPRALGAMAVPVAALLVLVGSFLLRTVVILSSEAI